MANNSIVPYFGASLKDLQEAAGITQFTGEGGWDITLSGIILQGNKVTASVVDGPVTVTFNKAFTKQVLGIFTQGIYGIAGLDNENSGLVKTGSVTLEEFILINDGQVKDFYWFALGI